MIAESGRPYLTAVICSRNDDHGSGMYERSRACFLGFVAQAERHKLASELIIVDWNPPRDRPLLKDMFPWPDRTEFCTVRSIVVPPEVHQRYAYSDRRNLHVPEALNVGIRRARGEFILSTTADMLFSDDVFQFLASRQLDPGRFYRADRSDVDRKVTDLETIEAQLEFCRDNIICVHTEHGSIPIKPGTHDLPHSMPGLRAFSRGPGGRVPSLHTNAPDFLLMSRERFHVLHGWPTIDIVGVHVDGLLCYMALASGAAQEVLPPDMRAYHIDHDSTWQKPQGLFDRLAREYRPQNGFLRRVCGNIYWSLRSRERPTTPDGVPYLSMYQYRKMVADILKGKRTFVFNDDSWGLKDEHLDEFVVVAAQYERAAQAN
jgi:hypothetical protein